MNPEFESYIEIDEESASMLDRIAQTNGNLDQDTLRRIAGSEAQFVEFLEESHLASDPEALEIRDLIKASRSSTTRVLIADDHIVIRAGLRSLLEAHSDFEVVGEVGNGKQLVSEVRDLKPDVVLLDLDMPQMPNADVLRELGSSRSLIGAKIIILTSVSGSRPVVQAIQTGAHGVLLKQAAPELLPKAIRTVMAGKYFVGREGVEAVMQPRSSVGKSQRNFGLTRRETEILSTIVAGLSNKEIAHKLALSEGTVRHHLTNIFDKVGVGSRTELLLFALKNIQTYNWES